MSGQACQRAGLFAALAVALGSGCLRTVSTPILDGGGCLLGTTAVSTGTLDPQNSCRSCQPTINVSSLSPVDEGTSCGDGGAGFCHAGACSPGCFIGGRFHFVGDRGAVCQACDPTQARNGWSPFTGFPLPDECAAAQVCSAGTCAAACFIDGVLAGAGTTNSANPCQTCQPKIATASWSAAMRGSPCADGGQCNASTCEEGCQIGDALYPAGTPEPGNSCWSCQPGHNWLGWSANSGFPSSGCDGGDVCDQGDCKPGCWIDGGYLAPGSTQAAQPCRVCLPAATAIDFTPLSGDSLGACGAGGVCDLGACRQGCFVDGAYQAPGAFRPANTALCCGPSNSTSDWTTTFVQATNYGFFGASLLAGDIDGDGFTDLVVGDNVYQAPVEVFFGDGHGGLRGPALVSLDFTLGIDYVPALALGDLDGDRVLELASGVDDDGGYEVTISSLRDGGFTGTATYPVDGEVLSLAIGDFDGDGHPDLAAAFLDHVQIFINVGDGGLVPGANLPAPSFGGPLVAADFDGDGVVDLAMAPDGNPPVFWVGYASGSFPTALQVPEAAGATIFAAALEDPGSARADLVAGLGGLDGVRILNVGAGASVGIASYPMAPLASLVVGDINGDGLPDLIGADNLINQNLGGNLELMVGSKAGFLPNASLAIDRTSFSFWFLAAVGRFEPDAGLGLALLSYDPVADGGLALYRSGCR